MARSLTNNFSLQVAIEQTPGVLPGSPAWFLLEPNSIGNFGSTITTTPRAPISKNRQRKKGTTTDLDSSVEFEADLTGWHFDRFMEGFAFAQYNGTAPFVPTAVTSTGYTVASGGALAQNTLIYARGFEQTANNGLKVVGGSSTSTEIKTSGLVADASVPANVEVAIAGWQGAAGDLEIDSDGNLISTTKDFTQLNLTVGQFIWIGGETSATRFFETENRGLARVEAIAQNKLTLSKKSQAFVEDDGTVDNNGGAGNTIQIFFGRFLRNVDVDDADYIERSFQFEGAYSDLGGVGTDEYEYAIGNFCNEVTFNLPLTDKATVNFNFIGMDTEDPTTSRKTNAATGKEANQTVAYNTSSDIARLRITEVDETGLTTDFKSVNLSINNNVSPEKVLGNLGARYMNAGTFEVNLEAQVLFTDGDVLAAIRNNQTVTMDFGIRNDDQALVFDLPAMTLGNGAKEFPLNETILVNLSGQAFEDPTLGTSIGVSLFPYMPAA